MEPTNGQQARAVMTPKTLSTVAEGQQQNW